MRAGIGVLQLQVRDDGELIDEGTKRLQRRRELGQPASGRCPARKIAAHRHIDEAEAAYRFGRRPGERRN